MNYLYGKDLETFDHHNERGFDNPRNYTKGQRDYSRAWLLGFADIWNHDGYVPDRKYKTKYQKSAYVRGQNFAKKVRKKKFSMKKR